MNKQLILLKKSTAFAKLPSIILQSDLCYYLSKDYSSYLRLNKILPDNCKVLNLAEKFHKEIKRLRKPYLEIFAELSKNNDSIEWWGTNIASRNSAAIPLQLNTIFLSCAKNIIDKVNNAQYPQRVIFIADSQALLDSISILAMKSNYNVYQPQKNIIKTIYLFKLLFLYILRVVGFLFQSFNHRRLAYSILNPLNLEDIVKHKYVIIRSWITKGTLQNNGIFKDRNFGVMPEWLKSKGYKVIMLPMFFNLDTSTKNTYLMIKNQDVSFLIQHHYLRLIDYLYAIQIAYKQIKIPLNNIMLESLDLTLIFREIQLQEGFARSCLSLSLCYPLLKRLKEIGIEIDRIFYPFENNIAEKTFILGCRKYFPDSKIIAYQHTVWWNNQLGMFISNDEVKYHPIADKIICSGPIYLDILKNAGFPEERLVAGPNLRFASIHNNYSKVNHDIIRPNILLPLTFDSDLAYDQIHKIKSISNDFPQLFVYIRRHPLFSWQFKELEEFLNEINLDNYQFADDGTIQDWLSNTDIVFSTGGTIVIVETVKAGVPLIKVEPDNNFFLDPLAWIDYPIKAVNSLDEISNTIKSILSMKKEEKNKFKKIGENVLSDYFAETNINKMKVFIDK